MFVLGALALIVGKMGYLEGIGFWSIIASIAFAGIFVDGVIHKSFGMMLFSVAFLIIVNDELLGLEAITPWPVLGAALLGTIGLSILFPGKKHWKNHSEGKWEWESGKWGCSHAESAGGEDMLNGEEIWFSNSLGESVKYLSANEVRQVNLKNSFGSLNVYFNNAIPKEGIADVYLENAFGSIVLYIPSDWRVIMDVDTAFGGAEEKGRCNPAGSNTLRVHGKVSFGELEIRYL